MPRKKKVPPTPSPSINLRRARRLRREKQGKKKTKDERKRKVILASEKGSRPVSGKKKSKRADTRVPSDARRSGKKRKRDRGDTRRKTLPKAGTKLTKAQRKKLSLQAKKSAAKRIRDYRGHFIDRSYEDRLRVFRKQLVREGKVSPFISYRELTRLIDQNHFTVLSVQYKGSQGPDYFRVLNHILGLIQPLKDQGGGIIIKIKPFQRDWRAYSIKYIKKAAPARDAKGEKKIKILEHDQLIKMNHNMVRIIDGMTDLIDDSIDLYEERNEIKIMSPLFKITEAIYENRFTKKKFLQSFNYDDIFFGGTGVDREKFLAIMDELMETGKYS